MPESGWTYRPEYHLGDPAFSLFDPAGERSAVGLTHHDAAAICRAMNAAPAMAEALERCERWFRDYERQHRAKGTPEGNLKADTNEERADYCRSALSQARGERG